MVVAKAIRAGRILTPGQSIPDGVLLVEGDRLAGIREGGSIPDGCEVFDAPGCTVTPGLIDLHIHGVMGHNVMGPGLADVAALLPEHGVTSFLPTTLTAGDSEVRSALEEMARIVLAPPKGARPLGIHLEGPHLSRRWAGMAIADHFRPLTPGEWEGLQSAARGTIRMLTFAPEIGESIRLIPRLLEEGVVPAIGHSDATFEQVGEMVGMGLSHATHTFNAMRPFHHREPGVVGAVLYHDAIVAQLIADLHHVHPAAVELLFRLKGADKVALVSDAAPFAGLPDGEYDWGGETRVVIRDGTCRLPDGTLAGAANLLDQNLRNLAALPGFGLQDVLQCATSVPGDVLGVERGRLRPGWIADLVVWDGDFRPLAAMSEGEWAWHRAPLTESP